MSHGPSVAILVEPRAPGGTAAAVAAELRAIRGLARIRVHALASQMFGGEETAPVLADALDDLGLSLRPAAPSVSADLVILHNPSFLRLDQGPCPRIVARHLVLVTHENFLRPGGAEGFDVSAVLNRIDAATVALRRTLAPVSPFNRANVSDWLAASPLRGRWGLHPEDWPNVCEFPLLAPNPCPADRRGRLSRPGPEKFPDTATLDMLFPRHARANVILGADLLAGEGRSRPHWTLLPFRSVPAEEFFRMIDFFVFFTAPTSRESFGRVLAEAVAAGKVAISDPATAANFGGAVLPAQPAEVDALIARLLAEPDTYRAQVLKAQGLLSAFSAERFRAMFLRVLTGLTCEAAA